jgi:hypothetical protein
LDLLFPIVIPFQRTIIHYPTTLPHKFILYCPGSKTTADLLSNPPAAFSVLTNARKVGLEIFLPFRELDMLQAELNEKRWRAKLWESAKFTKITQGFHLESTQAQ